MADLTTSQQNYLSAVYALSLSGEGAQVPAIQSKYYLLGSRIQK